MDDCAGSAVGRQRLVPLLSSFRLTGAPPDIPLSVSGPSLSPAPPIRLTPLDWLRSPRRLPRRSPRRSPHCSPDLLQCRVYECCLSVVMARTSAVQSSLFVVVVVFSLSLLRWPKRSVPVLSATRALPRVSIHVRFDARALGIPVRRRAPLAHTGILPAVVVYWRADAGPVER